MNENNDSRKTERKQSAPAPLTSSLTNPAAEFIDTQLDLGPEYAIPSSVVKFDKLKDQFTTEPSAPPESYYDAATKEKDRLLAAMAEYETTAKPALEINVKIGENHSWDDVINEARKAETMYRQSSAARRCFRKLGSNAPALNEWLRLLPSTPGSPGSSYMSVFCGGFKLILSAATRIDDLRELTFESLANIPEIIRSARVYETEYKSPGLHQRNADLYVGVLDLLKHILDWYQQRATRKIIRAVIKQGSYEKDFDKKVKNVKSLAELMKDEVAYCGHLRLGRVNETVSRIDENVDNLVMIFQTIYKSFCSNLEQCRWQEKMWEAKLKEHGELLKKVEGGLSISSSPSSSQGTSRRKLLRMLPFHPHIPPKDILTTLQYGRNLPLTDQDRAKYIMHSPPLRTWITSSDSQPLILNGNAENEVISCVSFVSAMLARTLQDVDRKLVIVVSHFCALHKKDGEGHVGPAGMVGSLIGQLLAQHRGFDFSFYRRSQNAKLADGDTRALTDLFTELIRQLPTKTAIFCIIDSVSNYEGSDLRRDTCEVVEALFQLTEHPTDTVVKVLVTSPGRCGHIHNGVDRKDVFEVPEFVDGDRQGFSDIRWDEVRGGVEELGRSITGEADEEEDEEEAEEGNRITR